MFTCDFPSEVVEKQVDLKLNPVLHDDSNPDWLDGERARDINFSIGQVSFGPNIFAISTPTARSKAEMQNDKRTLQSIIAELFPEPGVGSVDARDDVEVPDRPQVTVDAMRCYMPGYPLDSPAPCRFHRDCKGGYDSPGELNPCQLGKAGTGCRFIVSSIKNLRAQRSLITEYIGTPVFDFMRYYGDQRPFGWSE